MAHVGIVSVIRPPEAPEEEKTINVDYGQMRKKIIQAVVVDIVVVVAIKRNR